MLIKYQKRKQNQKLKTPTKKKNIIYNKSERTTTKISHSRKKHTQENKRGNFSTKTCREIKKRETLMDLQSISVLNISFKNFERVLERLSHSSHIHLQIFFFFFFFHSHKQIKKIKNKK